MKTLDIHNSAFTRIRRPEVRARVKQVEDELGRDETIMLAAMIMAADENERLEATDAELVAFIEANIPILYMFIDCCVNDIEIPLLN